MTDWRGWRIPHPDMVILDEAPLVPLRTVTFDEAGVEHVVADWPGIEWPRKSGKGALRRALSGELTVEFPASQSLARAFNALFAADWARQERMLQRLAADLGTSASLARKQFQDVVRVLEDAGLADGYGRLTIPQPVRPPILAPSRR
ncbi:hypothetical protein ABZT17_12165 [Streptomyces sp. NPDC005648]|uniref:hypothetical protein n=1 Tax=Streptomyces sp. NPDC005648 TaxID=3157044 RepID=UPI0033A27C24